LKTVSAPNAKVSGDIKGKRVVGSSELRRLGKLEALGRFGLATEFRYQMQNKVPL